MDAMSGTFAAFWFVNNNRNFNISCKNNQKWLVFDKVSFIMGTY